MAGKIQFTSGPWVRTNSPDEKASAYRIDGPKRHGMAWVSLPLDWVEGRANADLISQAPALYDEIEWIIEICTDGRKEIDREMMEEIVFNLTSALAKARGEG